MMLRPHAQARRPGGQAPRWLVRTGQLGAVVLAAAVVYGYFAARTEPSEQIYATEYGPAWPWPWATSATLRCHVYRDSDGERRVATLVTMNGDVYALNAAASDISGLPDSRGAMASDDPSQRNGRKRIAERARKLCS